MIDTEMNLKNSLRKMHDQPRVRAYVVKNTFNLNTFSISNYIK